MFSTLVVHSGRLQTVRGNLERSLDFSSVSHATTERQRPHEGIAKPRGLQPAGASESVELR